ncbi:hypothetical protein [Lapidilactobacillus luobeiensis]|uniref:hypothetical protein n=1 Tax=Lapidilactobacillus luobeiensis TaxID=2950371 RepID=UPI0021C3B3BE|nr:hypothetical protein [Lapidilactobacillus luobeiensis]
MKSETQETARDHYLQKFRRENQLDGFGDASQIKQIGVEIVDLLKEKDLTHDEAYASLQYAYNLIKYESNFLKLK